MGHARTDHTSSDDDDPHGPRIVRARDPAKPPVRQGPGGPARLFCGPLVPREWYAGKMVRRIRERVVEPVTVQVLAAGSPLVRGITQDLGLGGLFLRTASLLPVGT